MGSATLIGKCARLITLDKVVDGMKPHFSFAFFSLLVTTLLAPASSHGQPALREQGALAPEVPQERQIMAREGHVWTMMLAEGQYVEVEVEQQDVDVVVRVTDPSGSLWQEADNTGAPAKEHLRWFVWEGGTWRVEMFPFEDGSGSYSLRWAVQRAGSERDRLLVQADSLRMQGMILFNERLFEEAEPLFKQALERRTQIAGTDSVAVAQDLYNLGSLYYWQSRYNEAEPYLRRALAIRERVPEGDPLEVATVLNQLGELYYWQARYDEAEPYFARALAIREQVLGPEQVQVAHSLNSLAAILDVQGRYDEALPLYTRALSIMEQTIGLEDPRLASLLNNLALLHHNAGRFDEAEPLYRRALGIRQESRGPAHPDVATDLSNLALLYMDLGRYEEAAPMFERALAIQEQALGNTHPSLATTLNNQAVLFDYQGRYAEVEPLYRRALALIEAAYGPDYPEVAPALNNLGLLLMEQGRYREAEPMLRRSLAIREQAMGPDHRDVGIGLLNLAGFFEAQGVYAEAETMLTRATEILENTLGTDHPEYATVLGRLAGLYAAQRRYEEAEALHHQALDLQKRTLSPEHPDVAITLNNLATLYVYQDRFEEAEPLLRKALSIQEKTLGRETLGFITGLNNFGFLLTNQERYATADSVFGEAVAIHEQALGGDHPALTFTLIGLARNKQRAGQPAPGFDAINRALDLFDDTPGYWPVGRLTAYLVRAKLHKKNGQLGAAIEDFEEALGALEDLRPGVGGGEQTRADFMTEYAKDYDNMVAWLLEAGEVEDAFEYAERGRARVLLDQLAAGKIDLRASMPAHVRADLEVREGVAKARLAGFQHRITLLRARAEVSEEERLARLAALEDSLASADQAYRQVYREIKNASPLWRDLITSDGEPVDLGRVQRRLVPQDGLLLLYQIGEEASYLFIVPPGRENVAVLTLEVGPEQAAVLGLGEGPLTTTALRGALGAERTAEAEEADGLMAQLATRGTRVVRSQGATPEERLHALWQVLLPDKVWLRVAAAAAVVLIPDGPLHFLPFETLVVALGTDQAPHRYWLDEGPVIRYAPSATALYNITQRPASRTTRAVDEATVLSLSDPVFNPEAVAASTASTQGATADVAPTAYMAMRNSYERLGGSFAPLPGTAQETAAIADAFAGVAATKLLAFQGTEATEANLRGAVPGKRYLHLATHGFVDQRRGALFASLVLTPPPGQTATLENDGFLQLHEIYGLPLAEVELAVLSACETNVGPNVDGEGVFALSRGFLAAGARRVIASHWPVDDASTAALMGQFFEEILAADRAGRPVDYGQALREAKRWVRAQAQWSDAYFWAPFILTGEQ